MRSGFRVARLFGINIYIDWSWIFIFLLVTWNLAGVVFPTIYPQMDFGTVLALSVGASLLFFASVLVHELAHSLMAKARGLPVRRITLFIFGVFPILNENHLRLPLNFSSPLLGHLAAFF
jgi:Zn-dependent protease